MRCSPRCSSCKHASASLARAAASMPRKLRSLGFAQTLASSGATTHFTSLGWAPCRCLGLQGCCSSNAGDLHTQSGIMSAVEEQAAAAPAAPELPLLSLDVLQTIRTAQAQHGLRHGDYGRYRWGLRRTCNRCHLIEPVSAVAHQDVMLAAGSIARAACGGCTKAQSSCTGAGALQRRSWSRTRAPMHGDHLCTAPASLASAFGRQWSACQENAPRCTRCILIRRPSCTSAGSWPFRC